MKTIEITPKKLGGSIQIPPSKSVSHRAVMCAALAEGQSKISNILLSDDIRATCGAMEALGAHIAYEETGDKRYTLTIDGCPAVDATGKTVDCIESGSTLRFMIPLMALKAKDARVIGRGRLASRPMGPYYELVEEQGIDEVKEAVGLELPRRFSGRRSSGTY
ncbi:MAG: 3-phosphoshikimate 1-carboxyvinyltransferase, partial [Eubacterium sp.]|nr:3-phosphoshikimate 1-carboxyvinyltransferase [Eubacterium sp.]